MTKQKSTKRALLLSALSLLMCVSMLIGSTFAWFTDSVTSAGNKIQSGTLKLDLELYDAENKTWNSIKESKAPIFDYDLWEPGYTEVQLLKVENEGTLALKWMAKFVSENELTALAKVIDVYVRPYGVQADATGVTIPADRNLDGYTKAGTLESFVNTIETTTYGNLEAGEAAYLGIALKMQESAGNEYQGMDLGGAFDIQILATQYTSESDSFNNQYDANAKFDGEPTTVSTLAEFTTALKNGEPVKLMNDLEVMGLEIDETAVIDLNGNDLTVYAANGSRELATAIVTNNGDLTITGNGTVITKQINNNGILTLSKGVTIETSGSNAILNNESGTVTLNGATIIHSGSDYAVQNKGKTIINNVAVTSSVGVIDNVMGNLTINGGEFTNNGIYCSVIRDANGNAETIINGGTFIQNGEDPLVNLGMGMLGTLTVNGGTFDATSMFCGYANVTVNAGVFKNNATVVDYIFGIDRLVPATSTATTNADGSVTVTVNN